MSNQNGMARLLGRLATSVFAFALVAIGAYAQDTSRTVVRQGASSFDTQVKNAEIVYVEGNDLVLKLEDGKIEHLVVPDTDTFTIDGKDVTVRDLAPGTKLTQTITTTTAPRYVTTIRTIKGKVWHVGAPGSVSLNVPGGPHQIYKIPNHAKIIIGGKPKTVFDLRKGMTIEATIVTDDTETVMERSKAVIGQAPPPPATPREVGVLLILPSRPAAVAASAAAPVLLASAEQPAAALPKTGTLLPLAGLLGVLGVATSLGLGTVRQALRA